jgi:eukaryotic-like serine/threonine-protein kinase
LKKVEVTGGKPQVICDVGTTALARVSGTWNQEGTILFGLDTGRPIYKVSASGGQPVSITTVDKSQESGHFRPVFLPDGRHFLYLAASIPNDVNAGYSGTIYAASLESPEKQIVLPNSYTTVQYVPPRYLLYVRDGALFAQTFDPSQLKLSGDPVEIVDSVLFASNGAAGSGFSASATGTLIYRTPTVVPPTQIKWFDRFGKEISVVGQPDFFKDPRLSPDGRLLAVSKGPPNSIWLFETSTGAGARFTFDEMAIQPIWTSDGKRIMFKSAVGSKRVYQKQSNGEGAADVVLDNAPEQLDDLSPDGRYLVFSTRDPKTNRDVIVLPLADRKPVPFATTLADETQAQISPDGKWIAYVSGESGRAEIYVQNFPKPGGQTTGFV